MRDLVSLVGRDLEEKSWKDLTHETSLLADQDQEIVYQKDRGQEMLLEKDHGPGMVRLNDLDCILLRDQDQGSWHQSL